MAGAVDHSSWVPVDLSQVGARAAGATAADSGPDYASWIPIDLGVEPRPEPPRGLLGEAGAGVTRGMYHIADPLVRGFSDVARAGAEAVGATGVRDWIDRDIAARAATRARNEEELAPSVPLVTDVNSPGSAARFGVSAVSEALPMLAALPFGPVAGTAMMVGSGALGGGYRAADAYGNDPAAIATGAVAGGAPMAIPGYVMFGQAGRGAVQGALRGAGTMAAVGAAAPYGEALAGPAAGQEYVPPDWRVAATGAASGAIVGAGLGAYGGMRRPTVAPDVQAALDETLQLPAPLKQLPPPSKIYGGPRQLTGPEFPYGEGFQMSAPQTGATPIGPQLTGPPRGGQLALPAPREAAPAGNVSYALGQPGAGRFTMAPPAPDAAPARPSGGLNRGNLVQELEAAGIDTKPLKGITVLRDRYDQMVADREAAARQQFRPTEPVAAPETAAPVPVTPEPVETPIVPAPAVEPPVTSAVVAPAPKPRVTPEQIKARAAEAKAARTETPETFAERLKANIAALDARKAPDADYQGLLSTSGKTKGANQTWRDRAVEVSTARETRAAKGTKSEPVELPPIPKEVLAAAGRSAERAAAKPAEPTTVVKPAEPTPAVPKAQAAAARYLKAQFEEVTQANLRGEAERAKLGFTEEERGAVIRWQMLGKGPTPDPALVAKVDAYHKAAQDVPAPDDAALMKQHGATKAEVARLEKQIEKLGSREEREALLDRLTGEEVPVAARATPVENTVVRPGGLAKRGQAKAQKITEIMDDLDAEIAADVGETRVPGEGGARRREPGMAEEKPIKMGEIDEDVGMQRVERAGKPAVEPVELGTERPRSEQTSNLERPLTDIESKIVNKLVDPLEASDNYKAGAKALTQHSSVESWLEHRIKNAPAEYKKYNDIENSLLAHERDPANQPKTEGDAATAGNRLEYARKQIEQNSPEHVQKLQDALDEIIKGKGTRQTEARARLKANKEARAAARGEPGTTKGAALRQEAAAKAARDKADPKTVAEEAHKTITDMHDLLGPCGG